jgi:signal transduction histidine kinase
MARWLLLVAMTAAASVVSAQEATDIAPQKQVLVLYSTRRDAQVAVVGDHEVPTVLEHSLSTGLDYYSEFIDQARFSETDYQRAFRDFLSLKYEGKSFDVVVAMGDIPYAFLGQYRSALFPHSPVVFFTARSSTRRLANSTGISIEVNLKGTVELAAALQPDLRHVFVVSGADATNRAYAAITSQQLQAFAPRLDVTFLSGLPTRELEARLAALPAQSMVYYLVVDRDGANQNFSPLEYVDRVTAVSSAPVYCWVDSAMGRGIVGGSLKDQVAQARTVGALAARVLNGERADDIPVSSPDLNVTQVDWRQLRRWGISEERVPAGTVVRFRQPSAWDRYRVYILGAAALVFAQSVLIAALLVQHERRRRAEVQLRTSQENLRGSYDRIRDLGVRLLDAQEGERSRIARELHDDIGQKMAVLTIDLQLLSQRGAERPADADRLALGALDQAQAVSKSVRAMSHGLHPENLRLIGLVPALSRLQRELSTADVTVTFSPDCVPELLSPDLTLALFRIAQEAVKNAIAHSRAREVSIRLTGIEDGVVLTVADNGQGFDVAAARSGIGLISMGERAEQAGGVFHIRSKRGEGTHVEVRVPLHAEQMKASNVI